MQNTLYTATLTHPYTHTYSNPIASIHAYIAISPIAIPKLTTMISIPCFQLILPDCEETLTACLQFSHTSYFLDIIACGIVLYVLCAELVPWRWCLGHPHEVHVAGQQWEVIGWWVHVGIAQAPICQEHVNYQLQISLPSDRLTKQDNSYRTAQGRNRPRNDRWMDVNREREKERI